MGDLIRECGGIINYFGRFPVDVVQASKLQFLRAKGESRSDGLELQTMLSSAKRARVSSVFSIRSLQILSGISRETDNIYQTVHNPWKALSSNSISGFLTFHGYQ